VTITLDKRVDDFIATERQLFIDGKVGCCSVWPTFVHTESRNRRDACHCGRGGRSRCRSRRPRGAAAFEEGPWAHMTPSERGRIIWRIGDLILEHVDELAQIETLDKRQAVQCRAGGRRSVGSGLFPLHGGLGHEDRR